jgi:acetyl-CoA carboxylase/biotin carboxylase 1
MKMMMPLLTPAAGIISFLKPEGAALGPGDLIGRLELDDPNAVVRGQSGHCLKLAVPVVVAASTCHLDRQAAWGWQL